MKKLICILSLLCLFLLTACSVDENTNEQTNKPESEVVSSGSITNNTPQVDNGAENNISEETDVVSNTKIKTTDTENFVSAETFAVNKELQENTEKVAEVFSAPSKVEQTTSVEKSQNTKTTSDITEPKVEPMATAADTEKIANLTVKYINEYRVNEGVSFANILSGLTEYAKYRSSQLVNNFAHDTADERAAATALQYGEYVEPSLYGMTGEPYYTANAREAIAKTDFSGTVEQVAKRLAKLTYKSESHWSYVGSNEYPYIAIGVTYDNGNWYCCIAMAKEDMYEK